MKHNPYVYILLSFAASYLVRILPLTLIRKPIESRFVRSFLHYVPYVTLAVMTFPAILYATDSVLVGALVMGAGVIAAWLGANTFINAILCTALAFVLQLLL